MARSIRRSPGEKSGLPSLLRLAYLAAGMQRALARPLHLVSAELVSQACDEAGGEVDAVAAFEAGEEGGGDDGDGGVGLHGRVDRPAAFAAVFDVGLDGPQVVLRLEQVLGQLEQPRP